MRPPVLEKAVKVPVITLIGRVNQARVNEHTQPESSFIGIVQVTCWHFNVRGHFCQVKVHRSCVAKRDYQGLKQRTFNVPLESLRFYMLLLLV